MSLYSPENGVSKIPRHLWVTPYYKDPEQNQKDKAVLERDAWAAYDYAMAGRVTEAANILEAWALNALEPANAEGRFVMTFKGSLLLEAYRMLPVTAWNSGIFPPWVWRVYRPCAERFYCDADNQGSWGILGCVLADLVLLDRYNDVEDWRAFQFHKRRLARHISYSWRGDGTMTQEIKRTNSGIWYSYFSLAPMLRACELLGMDPLMFGPPLGWLFKWCEDPDSWPWRPKDTLWGRLERWLHPCADELERPDPMGWPANLLNHAAGVLRRPEWALWGKQPPYQGVNIYRCG